MVAAEVFPDGLDGVQFGRVGRSRQQGEVGRHAEPAALLVPACTVADDDAVSPGSHLAADLGEMEGHGLAADAGQHQGCADVAGRADGAEQIGPLVAAVARLARLPRLAQMRVSVPCWPTRASSWNQTSTGLPMASRGRTAAAARRSFFERLLHHRIALGMLRTHRKPAEVEPPQQLPRCVRAARRRTRARSGRAVEPAASAPARRATQGQARSPPSLPRAPHARAPAAVWVPPRRDGPPAPTALPRCSGVTQSRSVCRAIPHICAASVREQRPSSSSAIASIRRDARASRLVDAARRRSDGDKSKRVTAIARISNPPRKSRG